MHKPTQATRLREFQFAALAIMVVVAASVGGQIATFPNLTPWYAGLVKSSFNPPNWVFGPVWTTLYALMAFSLWRILAASVFSLAAIGSEPVLPSNWAEHGLGVDVRCRSQSSAGRDQYFSSIAVVGTAAVFHRLDRIAGWCLVPSRRG
jgi:translocator protein